jgi:hypothetical protein
LTEFTKLTKLNAESRPETATPDQGAFAAKVQERAKSGGGEFDRERPGILTQRREGAARQAATKRSQQEQTEETETANF